MNVHVGIDEAAVSALYNGRIETPKRQSPSRRMHESPNRHGNIRSAGTPLHRMESSTHRIVSEEATATQRTTTEDHPSSADFPPLGANPVAPVEASQVVTVAEEVPEPEAPSILQKPRPAEPTVTEDDMMAFFLQ